MATCSLSSPPKRYNFAPNSMPDPSPSPNPNPNPIHSNGPHRPTRPKAPPGQVAFRLLCHASRIGGVIGKSGSVIKSLQQATGARIRVDDAPPDSPDRVIVVVAPASPAAGNSDGGGDEVSKAQEALVKVFERVLDVAAESDGVEFGDDRVVSCRLVAETAQVGSVIGKGGKVVEKIRRDTGCRIRVLNDRLPACTAPSDEIVEIEGNVSSVKKALVAVSRRLQDCLPADRMKMMGSRPYEVVQHEASAVPHETLTDPHSDHARQWTSAFSNLSSSSNLNSSGVHPWSAEVNRIPNLDTKASQREVTFRILCSNDRVGAVIGKGGSIVKALTSDTGATISIGSPVPECEDRLITINASEFWQNPELRYSPAQKAVVLVFSRSVDGGVEKWPDLGSRKELSVTARLVVPSNQVGCLIGKGGAIVSEMRKATGASIRIIGGNLVPKCASDNDQVVQIVGELSNVQDALYNVTGRLRDHLFASTQNSAGTRNLSSVPVDTSSNGRLRDPVPFGGSPIVGASHGLSAHSLSQSLDHLALTQNLDHSSSPGLWAPQTVAGLNSRGIKDVGRGLTSRKGGVELVSESETAIVTSTTVEIVVPDNAICSVFGENGSNLAQLRQISGAKVAVHGPQAGTGDRTIVISGTPDETRAAQSLLQAFILNGSS